MRQPRLGLNLRRDLVAMAVDRDKGAGGVSHPGCVGEGGPRYRSGCGAGGEVADLLPGTHVDYRHGAGAAVGDKGVAAVV